MMELFGKLLMVGDTFLRVTLEHGIEYLTMKKCIRDKINNSVTSIVFTKLVNDVLNEVEIKLEECNLEHGFYLFNGLTYDVKLDVRNARKERKEYVSCIVKGIEDTTFEDTTRAKISIHKKAICMSRIESHSASGDSSSRVINNGCLDRSKR